MLTYEELPELGSCNCECFHHIDIKICLEDVITDERFELPICNKCNCFYKWPKKGSIKIMKDVTNVISNPLFHSRNKRK